MGLLDSAWDFVKGKLWGWLKDTSVKLWREIGKPIYEEVLKPLVKGEYLAAYKTLAEDVSLVMKGLETLGVKVPDQYFKWVAVSSQNTSAVQDILGVFGKVISPEAGQAGLGGAWGRSAVQADLLARDMETPRKFTGDMPVENQAYLDYLDTLSPDFPPVIGPDTIEFKPPEFEEPERPGDIEPPPPPEVPWEAPPAVVPKEPPPEKKPPPVADGAPPKAEPEPEPKPEPEPTPEPAPPPPAPPPPRYRPPSERPPSNNFLSIPYRQLNREGYGAPVILGSMEGVWNGFKDTAVVMKDTLLNFWNYVTHGLQYSINAIIKSIQDITEYVTKSINAGLQYAGDALVWVGQLAGSTVAGIWDAMSAWFASAVEYAGALVESGFAWLSDLTINLWEGVQLYGNAALEVLGRWMIAALAPFVSAWEVVKEYIATLTLDIGASIKASFLELKRDTGSMSTYFQVTFDRQVDKIKTNIWDGLTTAADRVGGFIAGVAEALWVKILKLYEYVASEIVGPTWTALQESLKPLVGTFQGLSESAWNGIQGLVDKFDVIEPEDAPAIALGAFGMASGFGFLSHMMGSAAELVHPLKTVGVHYMSAFVAQMASFSTIAAASMGVFVAAAIRQPFQYYVQNRFRPILPDANMLNFMRAKREVTLEEYRRYMGYHGYNNNMINALDRFLWNDPRLFEVVRISEVTSPPKVAPQSALDWLARGGIIPDKPENWWYYMKFGKAGYDDVDLPILSDAAVYSIRRREQTLFLMQVRRLYREFLLEDKEVMEQLAAAGLREDVSDWRLRAMKLERHNVEMKAIRNVYIAQYRADVIDESDLGLFLTGLGYTEERVELWIAREELRKTGKAAAAVSAGEKRELRAIQAAKLRLYRQQFKERLISPDKYTTWLLALGLSPALVTVTVQLDKERYFDRPDQVAMELSEGIRTDMDKYLRDTYLQQFRRGQIDQPALVSNLVQVGTDPELATTIADYEASKLVPKVQAN